MSVPMKMDARQRPLGAACVARYRRAPGLHRTTGVNGATGRSPLHLADGYWRSLLGGHYAVSDIAELLRCFLECLYHVGIKVFSISFNYYGRCLFVGKRLLVTALCG